MGTVKKKKEINFESALACRAIRTRDLRRVHCWHAPHRTGLPHAEVVAVLLCTVHLLLAPCDIILVTIVLWYMGL